MNWLIETSVYLSITAIILLIFKKLFKNKLSARAQFALWGLLLIRFFIPFLPESSMSVYNAVNIPSYTTEKIQTDNNIEPYTSTHIENIIPENETNEQKSINTDTENLVIIVWLSVSLSLLMYFVLTYISFLFKLKNFRTINQAEIIKTLSDCKDIIGIKRNVKIISGGNSPLLNGIVKPVIILPEGYTQAETKSIFLHELCHLKHMDIPITWLAICFVCFNWFNPIIWYSFFVLRRDIEVYCDERVLKYSDNKKEYARVLLKTALKKNNYVLGTTSLQNGEKEVQRRIKHIAYFKRPKIIWSTVLLVIAAVICVLCLTNKVQNKKYDNTAVVINDTNLYLDKNLSVPIFDVNQNDIVSIIKDDADGTYYVQMPVMDIPPTCGYIRADDISFDSDDFDKANYGIIENAVVYNTPNGEDIYSPSENGIISILEYDKDYVKCSLIGGVDGKWIKKSDISYDIPAEDSLYAITSQYLSDEFFRVYSPYYEILNLSISNWQENANQAEFFYTMTHKNFDKDPDTVDYIKEAKENGSKYYEQLKKEYLEPQDANYEFKIIYENNEIKLYTNVNPKGVEWVPAKIDDFIN